MWGIIAVRNFDKLMGSSTCLSTSKIVLKIYEQTLINCQCTNSSRPKLLKYYSELTGNFRNHKILWEENSFRVSQIANINETACL